MNLYKYKQAGVRPTCASGLSVFGYLDEYTFRLPLIVETVER
ncbi:hypothetical protein [Paenibacillus sp. UMB7766-LJ446]|nr:hypothetical protein [Paenibacillus sp. UMB7766-LJ446]